MFGKLKDKLKGWVSKNSEEELEEKIEEPVEKKEKKKVPTKKKSEEKSKKKTPSKAKKTKEKQEKKTRKKETEKSVEEKTESLEEETKSEKPIEEKKSFFSKFKKEKPSDKENVEQVPQNTKIPKSQNPEKKRRFFSKALTEEKFEELFEELQMILLQHNVAYEAVESIEEHLKENLIGEATKEVNVSKELRASIEKLLINPPNFIETIKSKEESPYIILFAGINGSGKTTTIAKVAKYLQKNSLSVCLAAADTFRAAAIQQLEEHGQNLNVPVIKKDYGADPAAVGFDAIKYAKKHKLDVVLIDTAGRMQNSDTLMKELDKIARVTSPDMKIFLGESTTGNDATLQAKAFNDSIGLTGTILSKADVDESGGTAISVAHVAKIPILFLGTGQSYEDLEIFDKEKLIEKLGL